MKHRIKFLFNILLFFIVSFFCTATAQQVKNITEQALAKQSLGDEEQAYTLYLELLSIADNTDDYTSAKAGLLRGGTLCFNLGRYVEACEFYTKGMELSSQNGDEGGYLSFLMNIGSVFAAFKDYDRSLYYYKQVYEIVKDNNTEALLNEVLFNLTLISAVKGDIEQARMYLDLEKEYDSQIQYDNGYELNYNRAQIAKAEHKVEESLSFFKLALIEIIKRNDAINISDANIEMARLFLQQQQNDSALACLKQAISFASEVQSKGFLQEAYKYTGQCYLQLGQKDSALYYQTLYINLTDTIFNQQVFSREKAKIFQFEKNLQEQNAQKLRTQIRGLLLSILVIFVFLMVIVYYTRQLQKTKKLLVMRNEELIKQNNAYCEIVKDIPTSASKHDETPTDTNEPSDAELDPDDADPDNDADNVDDILAAANLKPEKARELLRDILEVMNNVDIISQPDFTMVTLAKMVKSNTTYISAVINSTYHKNFKLFLNEYRMREACRRLTDTEHYGHLTIPAIAETVGFSSRTNFLTTFKKIIGMTPSAYQKLALENKQEEA